MVGIARFVRSLQQAIRQAAWCLAILNSYTATRSIAVKKLLLASVASAVFSLSALAQTSSVPPAPSATGAGGTGAGAGAATGAAVGGITASVVASAVAIAAVAVAVASSKDGQTTTTTTTAR